MRVSPPRVLDLQQLQVELAAAGVTVSALGTLDTPASEVHTYDANGNAIDLPPAAAAIITAHTPSTALRDQMVSVLTSSVGTSLTALTQAQRLALIAGLLYKAGAVDRQGQIKPLDTWLI